MASLLPTVIGGYDQQGGLTKNVKPFLLADGAFTQLKNAYIWRDRVKKREGLELLGRLSRIYSGLSLGPSQASPWTIQLLTIVGQVVAANNANPGQITTLAPHGLTTGDQVVITNIAGATGYNNILFTITVVDPLNFTVGADATGFGMYITGGEWYSNRSILTTEPDASIQPGSVRITLEAGTGSISAITNADPAAVTTSAPHGLTTGDIVTFSGIMGMTELNTGSYQITVTGASTFTLDGVDSTLFPAYTSGGTWTATIVFIDQGNGLLTSTTPGNIGTINYITGVIVLTHTAGVGAATTLAYTYYPSLPVMGIWQREVPAINNEQTIFWDTKYDYIDPGTGFQQFTNTVWAGTDADFFWTVNYRGIEPFNRLLFATNFVNNASNPIRYYDPDTGLWTDFSPLVSATSNLYQARVLVSYYGRLVALNVWEGTTMGGYGGANNYFSRCRFSQIGNPLQSDAWQSDIFGKGGFIDCPTNEAIIGAAFVKNTLLVMFERSTWQLRYVGEYGLPFIFERISSDFGSESTFSPIVFDQGLLAVGDRAIVKSDALTVKRIDEKIPDEVFEFSNIKDGPQRIIGVRDFQRELVFWCYPDGSLMRKFPNYTLLYNYINDTFAEFRNNVTFFGTYQDPVGITWDSLNTFWDDNAVFWDDDPDLVPGFPSIVCGNQQGFIHKYGYTTIDEPSLAIKGVTLNASPLSVSFNVPNHNLENNEIIYITGLLFTESDAPIATDLNDTIFIVTNRDDDNFSIDKYNPTTNTYISDYVRTPTNAATYVGGGLITLFPRMYIESKDFNPYLSSGNQLKLSYIDFLTDVPVADDVPAPVNVAMSVNLFVNTSLAFIGNTLVSNMSASTTLTPPYYVPASDYVWHRFYATLTGQFIRVALTYNDALMNDLNTHTYGWILNSMILYTRTGGKTVF